MNAGNVTQQEMSEASVNAEHRILVVDDEASSLHLVGEILKRNGFKCLLAMDGQEGIEAALKHAPALILMDVMMPAIDGISACVALKQNPKTAEIPIIFLTAKTDKEAILKGFEAGCIDYVTKPFCSEELLARIESHLELLRSQQELKQLCRQKSELLTTLAHDVKSPAGAIYSLARLVEQDINAANSDKAEIVSMVQLIDDTATKMYHHVGEILDEERQFVYGCGKHYGKPVQVASIVRQLVVLNQAQARAKDIKLEFQEDFDPVVKFSQQDLTEMFDNLISNAWKFSRCESTIRIRLLDSQSVEPMLRFEVEDEAPIVQKSEASEIFACFSKGGSIPVGNHSSHGVGLSIVERLVELHHGTVGVEQRTDGEGNCFFIELPVSG